MFDVHKIQIFHKMYSYTRNTQDTERVVLGVIGADILFSSLYSFLTTEFDPCKSTDE